jgi:hypothetical protein
MPTEQIDQRSNASQLPFATKSRTLLGRLVAIAAAIVFCISSVFPVVAGLSKNTESFPKWWGPLDVGIAFFLAALAFAVIVLAQGRVTRQADEVSYSAYRVLIHGILLLGVMFIFFGDRIIWTNCITGFAWRTWLLLYCLPPANLELPSHNQSTDSLVQLARDGCQRKL